MSEQEHWWCWGFFNAPPDIPGPEPWRGEPTAPTGFRMLSPRRGDGELYGLYRQVHAGEVISGPVMDFGQSGSQPYRHFIRFSALDTDTTPAASMQPGEIGLYAADGVTQIQHGPVEDVGVIYLPRQAAVFGADAIAPATDLTAYSLEPWGANLVANPGSSAIVSLTERGSHETVFLQADQIASYGSAGYRLSALTPLDGSHTPATYAVSWDITATVTHAVGLKDLLDRGKLVLRTDLEGHESDEFSSYDNAAFGGGYWPGTFCFFDQDTEPTDDTNALGWPYLTSGSGTLAWGDLRADSNPDASWTPETLVAGDWPAGRVIHISPWHPHLTNGHVRVTLASAAAMAGTGNGAHLWARATWIVVGSLSGDTAADYFRWSEFAPTQLRGDIPPEWIPNAPWVEPSGTELTDATLSNADRLLMEDGDTVELGEIYEHHDQFHTGLTSLTGYTFVTSSNVANAGEVHVTPPSNNATGAYYIHPLDDDDKALLKQILRAQKAVRFAVSDTQYAEFHPSGAPGELFGNLVGSIPATGSYRSVGTALSNNDAVDIEVESRIPARGEIADPAYKSNDPNVAGEGGSEHQVWTRGTGAGNAGWRLYGIHVGSTAPSAPFDGMMWSDTGTDDRLKRYNGSAWV